MTSKNTKLKNKDNLKKMAYIEVVPYINFANLFKHLTTLHLQYTVSDIPWCPPNSISLEIGGAGLHSWHPLPFPRVFW